MCNLCVIADETNIFSMRVAAVGRLRSMFEQYQSIQVICHEPPHILVPILLRVLCSIAEAGPDVDILDPFIDTVTLATFSCDERIEHYNFTEMLLLSIVDSINSNNETNVCTSMLCLLARCLYAAPLREGSNMSAFRLSCKYAISGKVHLLVDKSAHLLTESDDSWEPLDLIRSVSHIMCALMSMDLISNSRILSFGETLSSMLKDVAEYHSKRKHILELVRAMLLQKDTVDNVFYKVNSDGALIYVFKCALTSDDSSSIPALKEIVSILCENRPKIVNILIEENLPEFCVESLRRLHTSQCSDSQRCKLTLMVMQTLSIILISKLCKEEKPGSRYMLESVLNIASSCVLPESENVAVTVLRRLVDQIRSAELSELKTAKLLLDFIYGVALRYILSKEKKDIKEAVELLLKFVEKANLNFECVTLLIDVTYRLVEGLGFDRIVIRSLLGLLGQLDRLNGKEENFNEIRTKALELLFTKTGVFVTNTLPNAFSNCNIARSLVDALEVILVALSTDVLFASRDREVRQNVLESCWHFIGPVDFIAIGRYLDKKDDEHRRLVVKKYILRLMDLNENEMKKIPLSLSDFESMLLSTDTSFSSNLAVQILNRTLSTGNLRHSEWTDVAIDALQERIQSVMVFSEDDINCLYLLFRTCSVFNQRKFTLDISATLLLEVVRNPHFDISVEPTLFMFLTTMESDIEVRSFVLEKLAELKGNAADQASHLFIRNAEKYMQDQLPSLIDVLMNRKVSEELMELIISVFQNTPRNIAASAVELIDVEIIVDALRLFKNQTSPEVVGIPWKIYQITGILLLITDILDDYDDRLTSISWQCLVGMSTEVLLRQSSIVLSIIRYLIRILETSSGNTDFKWPFEIAPELCNLLKSFSHRERCEMTSNEHFVLGACACLLVFLMCKDARVGRLLETLSSEEWTNLVCVVAADPSLCHSWTCAAINCTILLGDVISSSSTQPWKETRVLRGALVASALSGNLMLKDAALSCLINMSQCYPPNANSRVMHLEKSLQRNVAIKIIRQDKCLLGSELVYLGSRFWNQTFESVMATSEQRLDEKLKEAVAVLRPTSTIDKNCYGAQERDIRYLDMRINGKHRRGSNTTFSQNECRQIRVNYGYRAIVVSWAGTSSNEEC